MRTLRTFTIGMLIGAAVGCSTTGTEQGTRREPTLRVLGLTVWPPLGYTTESLYPQNIRTVYVPIFKSREMRRELEFALTEAVIKEIEKKTPYKVVPKLQADTMIEGEVQYLAKRVLTENADDDPSQLEVTLTARVRWKDLRTGEQLVEARAVTQPRVVADAARFIPTLGESMTTAADEAVKDLAEKVVEMMEAPW